MHCVRKRLVEGLATGFFYGKIRHTPGTFGTLWGIPVAWLFVQGGPYFYMIAAILLILFASAISELYERETGHHDTSEIVIDEVAGYVVTMTWLPATWQSFLAGFLVFRFFDILKPWPIGHLDEKIPGGLGTVLDDVAAGMASNVVLQIVFAQTALLGVQLNASGF